MTAPAPAPVASGLQELRQRLEEVAPVLLPVPTPRRGSTAGEQTAGLLFDLVDAVVRDPARDRIWLLLVALSATFPLDDEVQSTRRQLELASVESSCEWLLERVYESARSCRSGEDQIRLVAEGVVIDVDFTARHDLQTGIQRVVRHVVPLWYRVRTVQLAVWTPGGGALRELLPDEEQRVLHWRGPLRRDTVVPAASTLQVPWRSTLVLPEVPGANQCQRLAALAEHSGNRVVVVGYDCIPVISADTMPSSEPNKFVRYLSMLKHADVVAGVSDSASAEFRGFVSGLPAQGLTGPRVVSCPLADDRPHIGRSAVDSGGIPEVLVVGSHEPRKNHLAVLHAAEVLWREGLRFRLRFVGGSGWTTTAFDRRLDTLVRHGRSVTSERGLNDADLWAAFLRAHFTIFPSLHEGFGLPVVESLALGTPVIGTRYGSVAELATGGGMVLVDPRDDDALVTAMRCLLTEDDVVARLRAEALRRPPRTWEDYAEELWRHLLDPA